MNQHFIALDMISARKFLNDLHLLSIGNKTPFQVYLETRECEFLKRMIKNNFYM